MKTQLFKIATVLVAWGGGVVLAFCGERTDWIGGSADWATGWSNGDPAVTSGLDAYVSSGKISLSEVKNVTDSNLTLSGGEMNLTNNHHLWFRGQTAGVRPTFTVSGGIIRTSSAWVGSASDGAAGVNFVMTDGTIQSTNPSEVNDGHL